jgi:hypothetical protein
MDISDMGFVAGSPTMTRVCQFRTGLRDLTHVCTHLSWFLAVLSSAEDIYPVSMPGLATWQLA